MPEKTLEERVTDLEEEVAALREEEEEEEVDENLADSEKEE